MRRETGRGRTGPFHVAQLEGPRRIKLLRSGASQVLGRMRPVCYGLSRTSELNERYKPPVLQWTVEQPILSTRQVRRTRKKAE